MTFNIKIALLIKGNPNTDGGMQPLVSVGVFPPKEEEWLDTKPTVLDGVSYTIKHCPECILYKLTDVKVRPKGSSRDGRLVLALAIPKIMRLADGKSPYHLLKELYSKFVNDCMLPTGDGYYRFEKADIIDRDPYINILEQFPVEECALPYITMSPQGPKGIVQVIEEDKQAALLSDSQYPEFSEYSEIEIGRQCTPTISIEIPRPREYKVFLNGIEMPKKLVKGTDRFNSEKILKDEECYTFNKHVSFTLQELIENNGTMFEGNVVMEGEAIKCFVTKERRPFEFSTEIKASIGKSLTDDDIRIIRQWLIDGKLCIKYGFEDISQAFIKEHRFVIFGEDFNQQVTLSTPKIGDYLFSILPNKNQRKIILYSEKVSAPRPERRTDPKPLPQPKPSNASYLEIKFVSHEPVESKEYVAIISADNDKKRYLRKVLNFSYTPEKGKCIYRASIILDEDWNYISGVLKATLEYEDRQTLKLFQSELIPINFNNNKVSEIDITDVTFIKKQNKFYLSKTFRNLLAAFVAGALISGLVVHFLIDDKGSNLPEDTKALQEQVDGLRDNNATLTKEIESLRKQLDEAKAKESTDDANAKESAEQIANSETSKQDTPTPVQTVDYKSQIVDLFNDRKYGELNEVLKKAIKAKQLTQEQRDKISLFWWNPTPGKNGKYTTAQQNKIRNHLHGKNFDSVEEIVSSADQLLRDGLL